MKKVNLVGLGFVISYLAFSSATAKPILSACEELNGNWSGKWTQVSNGWGDICYYDVFLKGQRVEDAVRFEITLTNGYSSSSHHHKLCITRNFELDGSCLNGIVKLHSSNKMHGTVFNNKLELSSDYMDAVLYKNN